jgi:DNA-binding MarR family transcriptional regulator
VPQPPALHLLVLHGVRLMGFAEAAAVAELWQLDEAAVAAELKELAADGFVQRRDGRVSGWSLTPEGRVEHASAVAAELDEAGTRADVQAAHREFSQVNPELLATCTAWQLRPTDAGQTVNDHLDHAYDASVVQRLAGVHQRVEPVLAELTAALWRFGRYAERLGNAIRRVQLGESEWFTKPLLDSYHTVWFELHEDLLATLGLQRGAEGRP